LTLRVTLYSKQACDLCDRVRDHLRSLQNEVPHTLVEVDVETEPTLAAKFAERVPVVEIGPYVLQAPFSELDLKVALLSARDGQLAKQEDEQRVSRPQAIRLNRGLLFFARHWVAAFNLMVLIYVGLPFVAPTLMHYGYERQARWIYTVYSPLCHQLAFRSWFVFGDQPAYPRALAGTNLTSFGQATGMDENDYIGARAFLGNPTMGYKTALCERDIGIYGTIFISGLAFAVLRKRIKPIPIWLWLLIGIVPIGLDGGTQLISALPIPGLSTILPMRESTPLLRTLTGGLFGVMNVWLAYPYIEESMAETRALIAAKLNAAGLSGRESASSS
jgi:uncharacterized membrane protein/glutaredoxin